MTGKIGQAQGRVVPVTQRSALRPRLMQSWAPPPRWLRFLLICVLALGIFFRFVNLDRKVYWIDEAYTSLRISGYSEAELIQQVSNGQPLTVKELAKFQHLNSEKSVPGTVKGLAVEEPQLPPLYFVLVRFWVRWFGDSVAVARSLSAVISLLALPCLYWLCLELFNSPLVGWVAVALIAVSPVQVIYAQEARPYALWVVMILLSSASLLRAIRLNQGRTWGIYAATVAVGIYSHLLFGLVAIAHGIYAVALEHFRWTKTVKAFLLASGAGILTFTPWIFALAYNFTSAAKRTDWQSEVIRESGQKLLANWAGNISREFVDFGLNLYSESRLLIAASPVILLAVILWGYASYSLWKGSRKKTWLFIFTLAGIPALSLILPDLILGGHRSILSRYMMPFHVGSLIAVAYLLAAKAHPGRNRLQKAWQLIVLLILSGGVLSCTLYSQAESWWHQALSAQIPVARIINKATRPLVLSELSGDNLGSCLSLTHRLAPDASFLFAVPSTVPQIPNGFKDVFLYGSSKDELRAALARELHSNLEPIYKDKSNQVWLWKLVEISDINLRPKAVFAGSYSSSHIG